MSYRNIVFILIQFFVNISVFGVDKLNILLSDSGTSPYSKEATYFSKIIFDAAVFSQLIEFKGDNINPMLLKNAYYDFQNDEYVLVLNDNIYFHNGRKANIYDLEFSILRYYFTKEKIYPKFYFNNILGIDEIANNNITKYQTGLVKGMRIIDEQTIRVKLKIKDMEFLLSLSNSEFSLIPIECLQDNYIDWKTVPIGAGNYAVDFEGYSNGVVKLKKYNVTNSNLPNHVELHTIKDPNIHYDILRERPNSQIIEQYDVFYANDSVKQLGLTFTNINKLANNLNFRKFVQAALNSKEFEEKFSNLGFKEIVPNKKWGIIGENISYSPEKAKYYYDKIPQSLKNKVWSVAVYADGHKLPEYVKIFSEEVKRQLALYGFHIQFVTYDTQILNKNLAVKSPFDISPFTVEQYDRIHNYSRFTSAWEDKYLKPLHDKKFEHLYKLAESASPEKRFILLSEMNKQIYNQVYFVPLLDRKEVIYYNKNVISSLGMDPFNDDGIVKIERLSFK